MEGRPAMFWLADFDGFRLGCRRSALGLVFDGIERPVSGSRDLLLDGMVGSEAEVQTETRHAYDFTCASAKSHLYPNHVRR